jgi:hypothetical protein
MTFDLKEALELRDLVKRSGKVFVLTHNYTGYPMVKEARDLVRRGVLGTLLKVVAEYPQDWLLSPVDAEGQKQAAWRTNPQQAGAWLRGRHRHPRRKPGTIYHRFEMKSCAQTSAVGGRRLEDDGNLLLRFKGGAQGLIRLRFRLEKRIT